MNDWRCSVQKASVENPCAACAALHAVSCLPGRLIAPPGREDARTMLPQGGCGCAPVVPAPRAFHDIGSVR